MPINKEWHSQNKMPQRASFEQKVEWHLEHIKHCTCAPIPKKLQEEMKRQGIEIK